MTRLIDADMLIEQLEKYGDMPLDGRMFRSAKIPPALQEMWQVAIFEATELVRRAPAIKFDSAGRVNWALVEALAHMWYAYVNKDEDNPHEFELEAVRQAEDLLGSYEECMQHFFGTRRADDGKTD